MGGFCLGFIVIASYIISVSTNDIRVKRYVGGGQGNDWNWNGQDNNGQASQNAWPPAKGDGSGVSKRRTDSKTNRDGGWSTDSWGSSDAQKKEEDDDMVWNNQQPQGNNKGSAYPDDNGAVGGGNLETLLRGVPGMDFPDYLAVPDTSFDCSHMPSQGYYGDVEAGCQVFHICQPGNRKDSFLCPVGTIFNQKFFVCDWWFNYNCSDTMSYYNLNEDIYRTQDNVVKDDTPATTEKTLPWSAQDLDKKRPTKSWGPSSGKQGQPRKDVATKRGGKQPDSVSSTSNTWSRTDVQKEVTLAWSTASGNYGSLSSQSTAKPIWYGIDGQPSKDQGDAMRKRNGLVHPDAPFGTRMKASSSSVGAWSSTPEVLATAGTWSPTARQHFEPTTPPRKASTFQGSTTTRDWLSRNSLPETSIVPTDVKGVWEQETTRRSDQETSPVVSGRKGIVTKSDSLPAFASTNRQQQFSFSGDSSTWGQRRSDAMHGSASSARSWPKSGAKFKRRNEIGQRKMASTSEINAIPRQKRWH